MIMKQLVILPCSDGQILNYVRALAHKFQEIAPNQFLYTGYCEPWEKVSYLVKECHPTEFTFYETDDYYVFRVWKE